MLLKSKVGMLEEDLVRLDQYSRKDVLILTGLSFATGEPLHELQERVLSMFNDILGPRGYTYSMIDFVAIHRNGNRNKGNGRPPSVTVKFVRFYDKDFLFAKSYIAIRKARYRGIGFHHCMCAGMIEQQNLIAECRNVKFVRYDGCNLHFTVCVKGEGSSDDIFYNRVKSFAHFQELVKSN